MKKANKPKKGKNPDKKRHIALVSQFNLWRMIGILVLETALCAVAFTTEMIKSAPVSIVAPIFGLLYILTVFEILMLLREGIEVREDGTVCVGKDENGGYEIFYRKDLYRIHLCDREKKELEENSRVYKKVLLEFRLADGRNRYRKMDRITQKQIDRLRRELAVGK